jgi:conjugal transfer pilus assembly protein TrbC
LEEAQLLFTLKNISILAVILQLFSVIAKGNETSFPKGAQQKHLSSADVEFAKKITDQQKLDLKDIYKTAKELEFITSKLPAIGDGCKDCGASVLIQPQDIAEKENRHPRGETPVTGSRLSLAAAESGVILVFVSFSMPKASLIELSDQCRKYNATLVLRGLHEDSFLKTKDKILEINPKGLQLDINPELFKQYGVRKVPTFVLVKDGKEIKRLSGNVTLEFAHQKLEEEP